MFLRFDSLPFLPSSLSSIGAAPLEPAMNRTAFTALVWPPHTASGTL
jgi:hypothetical protein